MKLRQFLVAAALGMASLTAQATVYTYTGNFFDLNTIDATPSRIVATFEFDFENSPFAKKFQTYAFKSWDVQAGSVHLSSANGNVLLNRFSFDSAMNITGWFFSAIDDFDDENETIQSLSENYSIFAPNAAGDTVMVWDSLREASIYNNQGSWTVSEAAVPEPVSLFLLGIGAAAYAGARRQKRTAA